MGQYVNNGIDEQQVWVPAFEGDNPPAGVQSEPNPATPRTGGRYVDNGLGDIVWVPDEEDGNQAANLTATLLRNQFTDWQKMFMPIELNAMKQLSFNNPGVLSDAVSKAGGAAQQQSETMTGILDRGNRALGIQPTAQQSQVSRRLMDLNKAQNIAGAENLARANVRIQDELVLLGGAPNPNVAKGGI